MATHAENKRRRRRQILASAKKLIATSENGDFSMEELAIDAKVGLTTPYNLFGSKAAIILALHEQEVLRFQKLISELSEDDPIERLLRMTDMAMEIYISDEEYFRPLCRASFLARQGVQEHFDITRDAFWKSILEEVAQAGALHKELDVELFAHFFSNTYLACIRDWADGKIGSEVLRDQAGYAMCLALAGAVRPGRYPEIRARIYSHQERLIAARASSGAASQNGASRKKRKSATV